MGIEGQNSQLYQPPKTALRGLGSCEHENFKFHLFKKRQLQDLNFLTESL